MIDIIGGRKFVFAILVTVFAFVLVLTNKITSSEFLNFVEVVGVTYVTSNVASKIAEKINGS